VTEEVVMVGTQDVEEFSEFAAGRSASLFRTAYLVLGDYQLAQDLVQESLTKTYLAWSRLREQGSAEAYTRRVIVTTSISWRRRRSFHERPTETLPEPGGGEPVLPDRELWVAVHLLPPRQRAAVVLRFCEDLSERQTAELMGCSVGSVKRHTHLGIAKLRAALGPDVRISPSSQEVTP
jgi:RNA polymerase sigma-70 factor (sigma-E family)